MENKIIIASLLLWNLILSSSVVSANQQTNNDKLSETKSEQTSNVETMGTQAEITTQTANQGENDQIQTQTSAQNKSGTAGQPETGAEGNQNQNQKDQQTNKAGDEKPGQQKPLDSNGSENQTQNQEQIKNQAAESQIKIKENQGPENTNTTGNANAEQRKSQVANAVQLMLQVAERNEGIGEQVRVIAQTQTQNQEKIEAGLEKIQNRSSVAKIFIGPDYKEINNTRKTLEQNKEQIKQLNQIQTRLSNQGDQQVLTEQIQTLEQTVLQIENTLEESQKGFSLLGWIFKRFAE